MFSLLLSNGLSQLNSVTNFQNRLLDLVFTSENEKLYVHECTNPLVPIDVFHKPLEMSLLLAYRKLLSHTRKESFNFKKADFTGINNFLASIDWNQMLVTCNNNVDECVNFFYDKLQLAIELFVPFSTFTSNNHPPWFNKKILNLKNKKSKAYSKYIKSGKTSSFIAYSSLRRNLTKTIKSSYNTYIAKIQDDLTREPKKFWSFINSKKKSSGYPSSMSFNNSIYSTTSDICNQFSNYFNSVYVCDNANPSDDPYSFFNNNLNIGSLILSAENILESLSTIDEFKGCGPDGIPPLLLKQCAINLVMPLTIIYNLSLTSKIFPLKWKVSYIVPIYKSGARNVIENYRGIAILSSFGKLFESIVTRFLTSQLLNFISPQQHGLTKGRSTSTNLVEFVNFCVGMMDNGIQVDVAYTDFSKAFDRILHRLLLKKLCKMGIHSSLLEWLESYLCNRKQFVKLSGFISKQIDVTSGVPQGSHLGPLLFILFMNDVPDILSYSKCLMFADDLKIYCPVKSVLDATNLQRDLDKLSSWCQQNCLFLNIDKCKVMSVHRKRCPITFAYHLDQIPLERLSVVKDLGVMLDSTLSFTLHVDFVVCKAYSMLGFMMRICADFNAAPALISLYFAHVRSHLEYAAVVWSPGYASHIARIESIQKKFLSFMFRKLGYYNVIKFAPYFFKCLVLGVETLEQRRNHACIFFVFDVLTGRIRSANKLLSLLDIYVPPRSLRNNSTLFWIGSCRTNYAAFEPVRSMSVLFNEVNYLFDFNMSRLMFKKYVRSIALQSLNEATE